MAYEVGDYVTIRNAGDTPVEYQYAGKLFKLEPGKDKVLPWGHMDKLMGNPFLTNADRRRERAMECKRLHTYWGTYGRDDQSDERWPKLEAYDSDGERIHTILDDPTGQHAPTASANDDLDPAALRAQLDSMARRQAALEELLRVQTKSGSRPPIPEDPAPPVKSDPSTPPPLDLDPVDEVQDIPVDVPEDKPSKTPVRRTRSK